MTTELPKHYQDDWEILDGDDLCTFQNYLCARMGVYCSGDVYVRQKEKLWLPKGRRQIARFHNGMLFFECRENDIPNLFMYVTFISWFNFEEGCKL